MSTIVTRSGKGSPLTNTEVDANFTNLNTGKAELSGAVFTGAITTNSTIDGRDVAADGVTADAALPKAGGAMTGAITTNSTFDGVDIATRDAVLTSTTTTANAALPKAGGAMTGAITTNSTFDGRDVATDGTKLDGVEASADVTDATNVTAAGALMDSELTAIASVKALNQGVATGDSPTFVNVTATSLDISGNIDVDGTTNLDVVDIDGAVDMASTLNVTGVATLGTGVNITGTGLTGMNISAGTSHVAYIDFGDSGDTNFGGINYNNDGNTLNLRAGNANRFTIDSSGNSSFTGTVTANAGVVVDNFTLDGTTLALSSGNMTLDAAGDIILDAGGAEVKLKSNGTQFGDIYTSSSHLYIQSSISDKDLKFEVNDNGSILTALTLDGSAAGTAIFNHDIEMADAALLRMGAGGDFIATSDGSNALLYSNNGNFVIDSAGEIYLDADGADIIFQDAGAEFGRISKGGGSDLVISAGIADKDIFLSGIDGSTAITALTLDMSNAGAATFNTTIRANTKIGIGMDPTEMLDITSASGDARIRIDAPSGSDTEIKFYNAGVAQFTIGHDDAKDTFVIGTTNVDNDLVSINKSGKVGIGINNPDDLLHINSADGGLAKMSRQSGTTTGVLGNLRFGNLDIDSNLANITATQDGATNSARIGFFTQPAGGATLERLRIHGTGEVTKPYQPAFMATRSGTETGYNASGNYADVVTYNNSVYNIGNHYDTGTGYFTAPVAGVYYFSASAYMAFACGQCWFSSSAGRINQTDIVMNGMAQFPSGWCLLKLAANDTVGFHPYAESTTNGTLYANANHTYFTGVLLG